VAQLNAWEASRQRENFQATPTVWPWTPLPRACCNAAAISIPPSMACPQLGDLTRTRRQSSAKPTAVGNRIHTYVDRALPGFLEPKTKRDSSLLPGQPALMAERFSSPRSSAAASRA